ncbi:MAG: hypothetical protein KUG82_02880 [Pseudomonadales bacterium]|nr:hypothetical protein [Pseudomonadales bacterium]
MDKIEAISIAEKGKVDDSNEKYTLLGKVEQRYIEVTESLDPEKPGRVRDVLAWIVEFKHGNMWVQYAVDSANSNIVRRHKSR